MHLGLGKASECGPMIHCIQCRMGFAQNFISVMHLKVILFTIWKKKQRNNSKMYIPFFTVGGSVCNNLSYKLEGVSWHTQTTRPPNTSPIWEVPRSSKVFSLTVMYTFVSGHSMDLPFPAQQVWLTCYH